MHYGSTDKTNNCRATFSWQLMTLGADMQIAVGAAVRGCCCGCEGGTERDRRTGQGCQLHVHFLHQWLIVLTISVCADITFKFLAKRVAQFAAKCKPSTVCTHTHLSPHPFPLLPSCYFCGIADECSQNWCMIPCGRLSASGGREACKIYSRCRFSRNSASFALL